MKPMIWRYCKPLALAALFVSSVATGLFACDGYYYPGTPYGAIQVYGASDCMDLTVCAGQSCQGAVGNWGWMQGCADMYMLQSGNLCGSYY